VIFFNGARDSFQRGRDSDLKCGDGERMYAFKCWESQGSRKVQSGNGKNMGPVFKADGPPACVKRIEMLPR